MWLNRQEWNDRLIELALLKADIKATEKLHALELDAATKREEILLERVKGLEAKLVEFRVLVSQSLMPPVEEDWFEEDEEEVRKDRIRIEDEGTSDSLLSEG